MRIRSFLRALPLAAVAVVASAPFFADAQAKDVGQGETITLTPPNLHVGETAKVTCNNFPNPTSMDELIVVAAGTPDVDPKTPQGSGVKVLWKNYALNCNAYVNTIGPFAPGAYEIRDLTTLYNNDNRREIATRTAFSVQ
jgi:hypothetical protein